MVTSVDVYKSIRALQTEGVTSQREAARILGISRNTVKKYWMGDVVPWDRKAYQREASVVTPEVKRFIEHCLDTDAEVGVKKQRHTARRIYTRLVEELGYMGSESAIRAAVHEAKAERKETDLLILDELSYLSFNRYESDLLFKVISDRSEQSSTIVTTNLPFKRWTELFENTTMVSALVDRLTYKSAVLDMNGPSYRLLSSQNEVEIDKENEND